MIPEFAIREWNEIVPWTESEQVEQDLLAIDERLRRENPDDERINVPSNRGHVWNYRMHISIERMLAERGFNEALRLMIEQSGRGR